MLGLENAETTPVWSFDNPYEHSRQSLDGDIDVDVAIVGAGYSGLWTALHLRTAYPECRIIVLDARHVGFGASGRNGGWCSAISPVSLRRVRELSSHDDAIRWQEQLMATVLDIGTWCNDNAIDSHFVRDGWMSLARNHAHATRLRAEIDELHAFGFRNEHMRWLPSGDEGLPAVENLEGALFTPTCAALHPGRLVHALAGVVEALGVTIVENTTAREITPRQGSESARVLTNCGTIRAEVVVRATEGFTSAWLKERRELVPLYSLMLATEPLPDEWWDELGWSNRCTVNDARRLVIYGQRTADNRLAFGGRGAPYHLRSNVQPSFDLDASVHRSIAGTIEDLWPIMRDVVVTHRWGGPLGIARDWSPAVRFDPMSGMASVGGYAGDGVAISALAGRTLAALLGEHLGRALTTGSDSTSVVLRERGLPTWWVNRPVRRWEPEPLRWLGVSTALALPEMIDEVESGGGHARLRNRLLSRLTGG